MEHSDALAKRLRAQRFRLRRQELAEALAGLLGAAAPTPVDDAAVAARLAADHQASYEAALPSEWALVRREWGIGEDAEVVETVHRLQRNLGNRPVWVLSLGTEILAVELTSDAALDNPLGLAAATEHRLAVLDAEVTAGLALDRHSHHWANGVSFSWELEVWGEPWLSAATRALRGVG